MVDTSPKDDRDVRAELPTRHPCPLCSDPRAECWLCGGAGIEPETYKAWILAGRPKVKPDTWNI